jgi:Protein of unknown function with PCYCGC motif
VSEPERTDPTEARQGAVALGTLGIAVLVMVAAGIVGVAIGMSGGTHWMMGDGGGPVAMTTVAAAEGFQLDMVPAHMVKHYEHARANPSVYAQVPCFCGCLDMLGHRNLEECFVTPDGAWESHASGCQICIQESQMLMRMMSRGMSTGMMADRVIAEFSGSMMTT